jgi:hypothetical protein
LPAVKRLTLLVLAAVALTAVAAPASAGVLGPTLEAPTGPALSLVVSRAQFGDRSTSDVVVTDGGDLDVAAIAAGFTGLLPRRAPLLIAGPAAPAPALRAEIERVTGGPGGAEPPRVWLAGTSLDGLDGYDVRILGDDAAAVAASVLTEGPGVGTGDRVLVFAAGDRAAGAVAAGFGAVAGIPVVALGGLPPALAATRALAIGSVAVPAGHFAQVDRVEGADPAALSASAAAAFALKELPAGGPVTFPVRPVAADGFGDDAGPALLAAVVAGTTRDRGALAPVLLVDGRPPADLAGGCNGGGRDKVALCALAQADGETTVLALTRTAVENQRGDTLPATGASAPLMLAGAAIAAALAVRRRFV